jgi:hypothetical protein
MKRDCSSMDFIMLVCSSLCFLVVFTFAMPEGQAQTPVCCWSPQGKSIETDFEGQVTGVEKSRQELLIRHKEDDITLKFMEKGGSEEQRKLLDTLKSGDTVKGIFMKENGNMYHLQKNDHP